MTKPDASTGAWHATDGSFRKSGVAYLGVLIKRSQLFRVLYQGPLFSETPRWAVRIGRTACTTKNMIYCTKPLFVSTLLYDTMGYCRTLCHTIRHYTTLWDTIRCYGISYGTIRCYGIPFGTLRYQTMLYYSMLYCTTLCYTVLYHAVLYCTMP